MIKLLKAIWNRFRIFGNRTADTISDKVGEAELGINDARVQARNHKNQVAELMASTAVLKCDLKKSSTDATNFEKVANTFADKGDVDNATTASNKAKQANRKVAMLTQTVSKNEDLIEQLRARLTAYEAQIDDAETDLSSLKAENSSAQLRTQMVSSKLESTGLGAVDALRNDVDKKTAMSTALEDIHERTEDKLDAAMADLQDEDDPIIARAKAKAAELAA